LEQNNHNVEIIDYHMENLSKEKLEKALLSSDAVGMTIYSDDFKPAYNISKTIKEIDPDIPLIIGGPHCTFHPKKSLFDNSLADVSVMGEGEPVILDLVKYIQGKKKLADIHGVYYRENGSIKTGKPIQVIEDLDEVPFPARHLVNKYDYGAFPFGYHIKRKVTALETSRGCPFRCRFCSRYSNFIKEWGFRQRSAENVVKEIQEIDGKYRSVWIADDSFLADNKRSHKIFDMLLEIGTNIDFLIEGARVDTANHDLYKKMKKAGVTFISYGIESGNQDVLDFYNKKVSLQKIKEAVRLARKMGFFTSASFIFGSPIEKKEHIEKTIKFACSLPLDIAGFGPLGYIRGSQLWMDAVKQGKISNDTFIELSDLHKGLGNFTREELKTYTIQAYKTFYFRPTYLLGQIYRSILRNDYSFLFNGLKFISSLHNISSN
jgi:anaerobic magnesium-protoporphyrin IX monomethyl ester cyclase